MQERPVIRATLLAVLACHLLTLPVLAQSPGGAILSPVQAPEASAKQLALNQIEPTESILSLSEAIRLALHSNHTVLIADEKIGQAESILKENLAQALPKLSVTASYGRQDPVGQKISGGSSGLDSNPQFAALLGTASVNTFNTRIGINQTLFAGFKIVDGIKIAEKGLQMQQESLRQTRQNIVYQVTEAYFRALKNWKVVRLDQSLVEQAERHLEIVQKKHALGMAPQVDRLRAQNQRLSFMQALSQDLRAYEKALASLNQLIGKETQSGLRLNEAAHVEQIEQLLRLQQQPQVASQLALAQRSEIRQLKLNLEIQTINATIQSRGSWPTLSAGASYSIQDTAVSESNRNNNQNLNYNLNLDWPLFDGFKSQALTEKTLSDVEQTRTQLDQQQQVILMDIDNALKDLAEIKERQLMSAESLSLAQEQVRISQKTYQLGTGSNIDLLDSQVEWRKSQQQTIFAEFDFNLTLAKLYQALGTDLESK